MSPYRLLIAPNLAQYGTYPDGDCAGVDKDSRSQLWGYLRDRLTSIGDGYRLLPTITIIVLGLAFWSSSNVVHANDVWVLEGSDQCVSDRLKTVWSINLDAGRNGHARCRPRIQRRYPAWAWHPIPSSDLSSAPMSIANPQASSSCTVAVTNDKDGNDLETAANRSFWSWLSERWESSWAIVVRCLDAMVPSIAKTPIVSRISAPRDQTNNFQPRWRIVFSKSSFSQNTPNVTPTAATINSENTIHLKTSSVSIEKMSNIVYSAGLVAALMNFFILTVIVWRRK